MRNALIVGLALVVMLASGGMSWADPPMIIRYQARLTDTAGVPLTGVHEIAFSLFDQATDGTSLWSEGPSPVDLGIGSVDFLLGNITPLTSDLFISANLWLEVTVDGAVLTPRQRLTSVPYALATDRLGTKTLGEVELGVDAAIGTHAGLPDPHTVYVRKVGDTMTGTLTLSPASGNALVTSAGNVGIGTTSPQSKLAVSGLPSAPSDASGQAGMLCITNDGNLWIDPTPATPCCCACTNPCDCLPQACVNGLCGACTSDADCCIPFQCDASSDLCRVF